jgi:hypothetical protein
MAEFEDTSAALHRLEAALNRIAAQVGKPRPAAAALGSHSDEPPHLAAATITEDPGRHEVAAKLDDLIDGLRNALGLERHS